MAEETMEDLAREVQLLKQQVADLQSVAKVQPVSVPQPVAQKKGYGIFITIASNDLEKVILAFQYAIGVASSGKKVSIFFTLWGMDILKKKKGRLVAPSNFIQQVFFTLMSKGTKQLPLSKFNLAGAGPRLLRFLLRKSGATSVEELFEEIMELGVEFYGCSLTMGAFGYNRDDFVPMKNFTVCGIAKVIDLATDSDFHIVI